MPAASGRGVMMLLLLPLLLLVLLVAPPRDVAPAAPPAPAQQQRTRSYLALLDSTDWVNFVEGRVVAPGWPGSLDGQPSLVEPFGLLWWGVAGTITWCPKPPPLKNDDDLRKLSCQQLPLAALPYCNSTLSMDERVDDLLARLNTTELVSQMQGTTPAAIPRLGLTGVTFGGEALHGVVAR